MWRGSKGRDIDNLPHLELTLSITIGVPVPKSDMHNSQYPITASRDLPCLDCKLIVHKNALVGLIFFKKALLPAIKFERQSLFNSLEHSLK